eukprot:TRINITY_DN1282_c0_g1_i3.p2 TRINITY_DN1282_c0_g1~~TRINITY_DN1282_c0_g1_i3.p2  ORF type:complete len:174 (-),score=26.64 TRINITY_DN1282_c0_g1_i3:549-1070(-)
MLLTTLLNRLQWGLATWPSLDGWLFTALVIGLLAVPVLPLALWANLFSLEHSTFSLPITTFAFFVPSLLEEVFWRLLLIPSPREQPSRGSVLFWALLSTLLFVLAHPLNAWLLRPPARPVFYHPGFLLICTCLGAACALAYLKTSSIWPAVVIHWLVVVVWLSLGGRHRAPLF